MHRDSIQRLQQGGHGAGGVGCSVHILHTVLSTDSPSRRRPVDDFETGYEGASDGAMRDASDGAMRDGPTTRPSDMAGGGPGGPISLPPVDLASLPELAKVGSVGQCRCTWLNMASLCPGISTDQ